MKKLNRKLAAANEVLAENIQELQTRLTKAIPALYSNASHEVVKVGNLNEIAPQKPKSVVQEQKEYYSEGQYYKGSRAKRKSRK
ncbi:hypothetical protein FD724_06810 [Nostoc sp. C057]|nr:hypothetical protein FD724_06810 [Nostoc sp. C057]